MADKTFQEYLKELSEAYNKLPARPDRPRPYCPHCEEAHCPKCGRPLWPNGYQIWM